MNTNKTPTDKSRAEVEATIVELVSSIRQATNRISDVDSVSEILMTADESLWDLVDYEENPV